MSNNDGMNSSGKEEDKGKAPLQEPTTNTTPNSHVDVVIERKITVNVFFDGTGNNKHNTENRLEDEEYIERKSDIRNWENKLNIHENINKFSKNIGLENNSLSYEAEGEIRNILNDLRKKQTDYKESYHKKLKAKGGKDQVSYTNEFSNIALLEQITEEEDKTIFKIYIQGAGTLEGEEDQTRGAGFASGETGAVARVNEAFEELKKIIGERAVTTLTLNVFGFSRGAFYARLFCAMAKNDDRYHPYGYDQNSKYTYPARATLGIKAKDISINFVGIYDTVSSHGLVHDNDLKTFPIDIGSKQKIKKIVHLTAQNDYRKHFPLTSLEQALKEGIAFECSLPGAHSNIGGGYTDKWRETDHYLSFFRHDSEQKNLKTVRRLGEIFWRHWLDSGYYLKNELISKVPEKGEWGMELYRHVEGNRTLRYHYQFILLEAMKFCMEEYINDLSVDENQHRYKERIEDFNTHKQEPENDALNSMSDYVMTYIEDNHGTNGSYTINALDALKSPERCKAFYHTYINNSLQPRRAFIDGVENEGTWDNQDARGNPKRPMVSGG